MDTRHFTRGCVHMGGVAILAVYINYANYICAILVLLAYSHKYRARINNRLYGTSLLENVLYGQILMVYRIHRPLEQVERLYEPARTVKVYSRMTFSK